MLTQVALYAYNCMRNRYDERIGDCYNMIAHVPQ